MTNPTVKVEDLTGDIDMLVNTRSPKLVGLGERALSENFNLLRAQVRRGQTRVFKLTWRGNKVPRGAVVLGHEVAWTQNGLVTDVDRQNFATYDRLVEFGPGDLQEMLVYTRAELTEVEMANAGYSSLPGSLDISLLTFIGGCNSFGSLFRPCLTG